MYKLELQLSHVSKNGPLVKWDVTGRTTAWEYMCNATFRDPVLTLQST